MNSDEIRSDFLRFFESKGHTIIPSSSLIPKGDPTLLLTTAGMVQFKPYYLGQAVPPNPRLTSCQKCFRTTDVESVGDSKHLTFFEMLGNFSIGDYFKKEAITWGWEFVTQHLKLPPKNLWITIYLDDDEAFGYWREIGVAKERIVRCGEKDNFWGPAGNSGPCGPCSEIHYDFGEEVGCGETSCAPNCNCGRFVELWNLVFTQYNQDESGHRTLLPKPNIDTGAGLERLTAIVQGKTTVYETDLFVPLLKRIGTLSGKKYGANEETDHAMRVVAEHSRGIAFLIGDGVVPSNEGRGYVLRRLLRRAGLFGKRLGLDKPFLAETATVTINQMGHVYPELVQRKDLILKIAQMEEEKFRETLNTGLEMLDSLIEDVRKKKLETISGKDAFRLYDTYGFPVELTEEIAHEHGMQVDQAGFEKEMEAQRERARATRKFDVAFKGEASLKGKIDIKSTAFVGYEILINKSPIVGLMVDGESIDSLKEGQEASVVLAATPFYGEMGGQVGDIGEIHGSAGRFVVTDTVKMPPDITVHRGRMVEGVLGVGEEVEAEVDKERRLDVGRNHTATHLLQAALRQVLGEHVQQRGSLVTPDRLRFDFSHTVAMTKGEIRRTNNIVNQRIRENIVVYDEQMPYRKAMEAGVTALFDEKYGDTVRVLRIGRPSISAELCGGTHILATGDIGFFRIVSESSIGSGLRRIEAVTGRGAEQFTDQLVTDLETISRHLDAKPDEAVSKAESLVSELKEMRKQILALERQSAQKATESFVDKVEVVKGVNVLAVEVPSSRIEILREMSDRLREQLKSAIIVLGTVYEDKPLFLAAVTSDLVAKGYHAGEIVKKVAGVTGGGGGGKPALAQAGGRDASKLGEALQLVKSLI